ncbi:type II toxin-antitoxin system VapC family toxin [Rhizobium sp. GN54]|uniref:type II toxin-antitoxin system VapC family toxin n=1 Tax=Rhizobium sp. GN54 TaxID=2898150 RepID=UPI001E546CD2|nr:type II toxin-antitoxin system VapC family toxin [Rhizobium sp. GN54]MCD2184705.1 type II toxin-antitoxin system VapC family toxin [Rhizobium sp. GN54]
MSFVVDASIAGTWLLPDEENEFAAQVMSRMADEDALAPDLLQHEIRSILLSAERRGRIDDDLVYTALSRFRGLPLRLVSRSDDAEVVRVARRYQLSAYDAAYLALALLENAPLATLDRKLASAARSEGVPLLGPLSHEQ